MANSEWVRKHYACFYSDTTGKAFIVDLFEHRLWLMRMRISAWANIVKVRRQDGDTRLVMITLTYRQVGDYQPGHINTFMKNLKQRLGDRLMAFAWVCELQARGAVHYHVMLLVPKGTRIPKPDDAGMWSYGMSRIETARTPFYLVSYLGKEYQKDLSRLPKSARLYAASIRFGGEDTKNAFRTLSGLLKVSQEHSEELIEKWRFMGTSIDYGFAEKVLLPSDAVLK